MARCNVGVIAGYHLLARRHIAEGSDWRAYRLLQLALIFVFTLRNAITVPPDLAHDWFTSTDNIVREIRLLRDRLSREQERRLARLPQAQPDLRIPGLRIAVVSICAYPENHPLVLRTVTPENRQGYVARHNYTLHVHRTHPMPGTDVHVQHAKLGLVANYLRSGEYDWVAWFDCDSIIMNLDKTLDSVIYRYARRDARPRRDSEEVASPTPSSANSGSDQAADEPLRHEVLETYVSHAGSCNTEEGCRAAASVRVNRNTSYVVTVTVAQADMAEKEERLASVLVGGQELGECNPSPESDYDCGFHECFRQVVVSPEAIEHGVVELEVHAVRTHDDCRCSLLLGTCYSAAIAQFEEVAEMGKTTDPGYGLFAKFTFEPLGQALPPEGDGLENESWQPVERELPLAPLGCSCAEASVAVSSTPALSASDYWRAAAPVEQASAAESTEDTAIPRPWARIRRRNAECMDVDMLLGVAISLEQCLDMCRELEDCRFASYGIGRKRGQCYWELGDCLAFEDDSFVVWDVRGADAPDAALQGEPQESAPPVLLGGQPMDCSHACAVMVTSAVAATALGALEAGLAGRAPEQQHASVTGARDDSLDFASVAEIDGIDLLITDEGWGLSSANWMIRRSDWSIAFLERAFALCHEEMPLFGDQDAMIYLLLNRGAVRVDDAFRGDPLDRHAVVIPQRELNAYDALNAYHMHCDAYEDGDLLITFPGCKEAAACNPLFLLASAHAEGMSLPGDSVAHLRVFGPPEAAAAAYEAARRAHRER